MTNHRELDYILTVCACHDTDGASGVTSVNVTRGDKVMVSPYFFFQKLTIFLVIASGE